MQMPKIQMLISQPNALVQMLAYKRMEEMERIGSDLAQKPFSEFRLFTAMRKDQKLADQFVRMQRIYIFDENAMQPYNEVVCRLEMLNGILLQLDERLERRQEEEIDFVQTML